MPDSKIIEVPDSTAKIRAQELQDFIQTTTACLRRKPATIIIGTVIDPERFGNAFVIRE